jgi:hypothetical protein
MEIEVPLSSKGEIALKQRVEKAMRLEFGKTIDELTRRVELAEGLVRWIAPRIRRRNENGGVSDRFCLLCVLGIPEFKRQPCRHDAIWELERNGQDHITAA